MVISSAGTASRAFQYTGINPQIKKAEPAYIKPNTDSDRGLGVLAVIIVNLDDKIYFAVEFQPLRHKSTKKRI